MTSTFSANLEHWPLDRLIPHARNAQTHSEDQVGQIAGSIAEFGFVNPILVGDDGVIVAGHGRDACAAFLDALHSRVNFRPSMTRGPIQYELAGFQLANVAFPTLSYLFDISQRFCRNYCQIPHTETRSYLRNLAVPRGF